MIEEFHTQLENIENTLNDAKRTYHEIDLPLHNTIRAGLQAQEGLGSLTTSVSCYVELTDEALRCANEAMENIQRAGLPPVTEGSVFHIGLYMEVAGDPLLLAQTDVNDACPLGTSIASGLDVITGDLSSLNADDTVRDIAHRAHRATATAEEIARSYGLGSELRTTLGELSERARSLATQGFPNIMDVITSNNTTSALLHTLSDFKDRSKRSTEAAYRAAGTEHLAMFTTHLSIACNEIGKDDAQYFEGLRAALTSCLQTYEASKQEKTEIVKLIDEALFATDRTHYSF